jgi:N-acetylglucosamine kinase-like BadF-type ATPase
MPAKTPRAKNNDSVRKLAQARQPNRKIFLGIDGGQSRTKAVIADQSGNISGVGFGGGLNHGNLPDGRKKLKEAITDSVNSALENAGLALIDETAFESAHCGLTGGADFKEEIVRGILRAKRLVVGNDALIALDGATAGKSGIIVIAGTGSIVYGVNDKGETARAGGLGYIFADEGSGFWLAVQTIKSAIREQDGVIPNCGLVKLVLDYFSTGEIRELTNAFYNEQISRDKIAAFAETVSEAALGGNKLLENLIRTGAEYLCENVLGAATRLNFKGEFQVSPVGGMFQDVLMRKHFAGVLRRKIPQAAFIEPLFDPATGAIILAYKNSNIEINENLLANLQTSYERKNSAK